MRRAPTHTDRCAAVRDQGGNPVREKGRPTCTYCCKSVRGKAEIQGGFSYTEGVDWPKRSPSTHLGDPCPQGLALRHRSRLRSGHPGSLPHDEPGHTLRGARNRPTHTYTREDNERAIKAPSSSAVHAPDVCTPGAHSFAWSPRGAGTLQLWHRASLSFRAPPV